MNNVNLSPFNELEDFMNFVIEKLFYLNELGLYTTDIKDTNNKKFIDIIREFDEDNFPPNIFSSAPLLKEKKTIIYDDNIDYTSPKTQANRIIAEIFNADNYYDIYDEEITENEYEVHPPVAILKNTKKIKKETILIIPNMDVNFFLSNNYENRLYYQMSSFQPQILYHAFAFYFIKNYSYECANILLQLAQSFDFIIKSIKNTDLDTSTQETFIEKYKYFIENYKNISSILEAVRTSIRNVTGIGYGSVNSLILKLANSLSDPDTIMQFQKQKELYDTVKNNLFDGVVEIKETEIINVSYTIIGEYVLVSEKSNVLISNGSYKLTENVYKISKNNVFLIFKLLRERIDTSRDSLGSNYSNTPLNISIPISNWDDAFDFKDLFSNLKIEIISGYKTTDKIYDLINFLINNVTNVNISYNAVTQRANISYTRQHFI